MYMVKYFTIEKFATVFISPRIITTKPIRTNILSKSKIIFLNESFFCEYNKNKIKEKKEMNVVLLVLAKLDTIRTKANNITLVFDIFLTEHKTAKYAYENVLI